MSLNLKLKDSVGTLKWNKDFNIQSETEKLYDAMKILGTDENGLIQFLSTTSYCQRKLVSDHYAETYGRSLIEDIQSELSGDFKNLAVALMQSSTEMACTAITKATKGLGTNENLLIAVLLSRTNVERGNINKLYDSENEHSLINCVESETSGILKTFLLSLLENERGELSTSENQKYVYNNNVENIINRKLAKSQAEQANELFSSEGKINETNLFKEIFIDQNRFQAAACLQEYLRITGKEFMEFESSKLNDDAKAVLDLVVRWIMHPVGFYAYLLQKSFGGYGTDENLLNFVIANRYEIDLMNIKEMFESVMGKSLETAIIDETSGNYRKLLTNLVS